MTESRYVRDGIAGPIYRVRLTPRELPQGGADPEMLAVVFEDILSLRVLTVPLHQIWHLEQLTDADLEGLLGAATR